MQCTAYTVRICAIHLTHAPAHTHARTHMHTHAHTKVCNQRYVILLLQNYVQSKYVSWFHAGWWKSGIFMDVGTLGHTVCKHFYWDNSGLCVCVCVSIQCINVKRSQRSNDKVRNKHKTGTKVKGLGPTWNIQCVCVWIWVSVRLSFRGSLVILRSYSWWEAYWSV